MSSSNPIPIAEHINRGLKHIEPFTCPHPMEAVVGVAAGNGHAKGLAGGVGI